MKYLKMLARTLTIILLADTTPLLAQFSGGSGTELDPYKVATAADLDNVRNHLDKYFVMIANINLTDATGDPSGAYWNGGLGWIGIGYDANFVPVFFTGSFDGNGHTILGLFMNQPDTTSVGLFKYLGTGGSIQNVGLAQVNITGGSQVGTLVGFADGGTVDKTFATGSITGGDGVGGLIGYQKETHLSNSYSTATVVGTGGFAHYGGLVGYLDAGTITGSYASGSVSETSGFGGQVGGLVGGVAGVSSAAPASITDSYAQGAVQGFTDVGGLVGSVFGAMTITNSYAIGAVTGDPGASNLGGLVGFEDDFSSDNAGNTYTNSFWDTQTTGQASSTGGTGKTAAEMQTEATFTGAGWNFTTIWEMDTYPELSALIGFGPTNFGPTASNIIVSSNGTGLLPAEGDQLSVTYDYSDVENDPESGTTFQWYRADDNSGTNEAAIGGATGTNYTIAAADAGKFLRVGITPSDGETADPEAFSAYTEVESGIQFSLAANGVIITCVDAAFNDTGEVDGIVYKALSEDSLRARVKVGQDVTNVCTSKIADMDSLFLSQTTFNQDISSWDVSNVQNMNFMFAASSFNNPIDTWNVSNVDSMYAMFASNTVFDQALNNWNVSNVKDMSLMFLDASTFNQSLDSWDVSSVTNMSSMFNRAIAFNGNISSWNTTNVLYMSSMFEDAESFNQDLSNWNVSNVIHMDKMFADANSFNGNVSTWDVSKVEIMNSMFEGAISFNRALNSWNVSSVKEMVSMFSGASLFNQDLNDWEFPLVTNLNFMFSYATNFNGNISSWDVSNVEAMIAMFQNAAAFNQPIGNWDLSSAVDIQVMFSGATLFDQPIGNWNLSSVLDISELFVNATSFNQPIGDWDVSSVTNMNEMFQNATVFNQNLTGWCVESITGAVGTPSGFRDGSALTQQNEPIWGTCPEPVSKFMLAENGVTITCKGAQPNDTGVINGITYKALSEDSLRARVNDFQDVTNVCTSLITNMRDLFVFKRNFNQDIGSWDVSAVTNMNLIFGSTDIFNADISYWDVSSVTNMIDAFIEAYKFNQDIGDWDVSQVNNMSGMFSGALEFNQDLSRWCVENISTEPNFFASNSGLDDANKPIWGTCPSSKPDLLTNGDFQAETTAPWFVNFGDGTVPVLEEGGNKFFIADTEISGDAFAVNLSQAVSITQGETYTLSFDASSAGDGRTMLVGIGLNEVPFTAATQTVNLTSSIQTFTLELTASNFGIANSRVLFDMGADTGVVVIDNVSLTTGIITSNEVEDIISEIPDKMMLSQNYPNPFNPSTVISYQIPENAKVDLRVYDVLGREVTVLVNQQKEAGYHQVTFNASHLTSGMYIYRLVANGRVFTKKLTLIK